MLSETMIGDMLDEAPAPDRPVEDIAPPPVEAEHQVTERFGIRFMSGDDDAAELLDEVHRRVSRIDPAGDPDATAGHAPGILLVGPPHTGQRRLARLVARTMAEAGVGNGSVRTADAQRIRGVPPGRLEEVLDLGGHVLLFERLDLAIMESMNPGETADAIVSLRRGRLGAVTFVATCEPRAFRRLAHDHPELTDAFRVFRLPGFADAEMRLALLHLLADERRVTVEAAGLATAGDDLERLRGPGDLVNARLVEAYLERACQRHVSRAGATGERLVLGPEDFAGVAEEIEPAVRPSGDVDAHLRGLDEMVGLEDVKQTVDGLVAEARLAADRAAEGLPGGNASRSLILTGPPGVGKATVAGLLGALYAALGLLDAGHVVPCRPVHLAGCDTVDTENRVSAMVDQAMGGVLLIEEAHRLGQVPAAVAELLKHMEERRDKFVVVCSGPKTEIHGFLLDDPGFRAEFGAIVDFAPPSSRQLVHIFQRFAERDLYMLDEELRVELLARLTRMTEEEGFAYALTVRQLFEETVARQAARLSAASSQRGAAEVNAATVARLTVRDLPETHLEQMLGCLTEE